MSVSQKERLAWLRLYRSQNVGPITFKRLIAKYGTAQNSLEALPELNARGGSKKKLKIYPEDDALREIDKVKKLGGRFCLSCDDDFPEQLGAIEDAPAVLSLLGGGDIQKNENVIGIVGARNASLNGRNFTEKLAKDLVAQDITIVSGLARGIDTAAHKGSLDAGTWAVVAGGVDVVYPQENKYLYEEIKENGLIISENSLGVQPTAHHFPRRNRIVSGLSNGVIIVEAGFKSGSLITARVAAEQGRDVYAVPGFPNDPRSAGPNRLLRDGAILLERAEDVFNQLLSPQSIPQNLFDTISEQEMFTGEEDIDDAKNVEIEREKIISLLSHVPISVDEIVRACHVSVSGVQSVLLDLEVAGRLQRLPGNRIGLLSEK